MDKITQYREFVQTTITERIQQRNADLKDGEYYIPDWLLNMIITKFEPPDNSENPTEIWLKW